MAEVSRLVLDLIDRINTTLVDDKSKDEILNTLIDLSRTNLISREEAFTLGAAFGMRAVHVGTMNILNKESNND